MMSNTLNVGGVEFHAYGLVIGLVIVGAIEFVKKLLAKFGSIPQNIDFLLWGSLPVMLVFARVWHLFTDWHLYSQNMLRIFYVWQGGLSIFGAFLGVLLYSLLIVKFGFIRKEQLWQLLDTVAIIFPAAIGFGRLANYFNYELYGLPTNLPWKIFIPESYRVSRYLETEYYHPLFLYEMIFGVSLTLLQFLILKNKKYQLGSQSFILSSLFIYLTWRFLLDWLRVERPLVFSSFSINQVILFFLILFLGFLVHKKAYAKT